MSVIFDEKEFIKEFNEQGTPDKLAQAISDKMHAYEVNGIRLDTLILMTFISIIGVSIITSYRKLKK